MPENDEDEEEGSEYSYLPDRKMRKKKKKKKKKKRPEGPIDERELAMAKAYGGLSQNQYDKLVALKKLQQSQLPGGARIETSNKFERVPSTLQQLREANRFSRAGETIVGLNDDQRSDFDGSQGPDGGA